MLCGYVRIRMSSSSTTTSDPGCLPKPPDSCVNPGVFARPGEARSGPDSAGIPQEIRSRCRLMPIR